MRVFIGICEFYLKAAKKPLRGIFLIQRTTIESLDENSRMKKENIGTEPEFLVSERTRLILAKRLALRHLTITSCSLLSSRFDRMLRRCGKKILW